MTVTDVGKAPTETTVLECPWWCRVRHYNVDLELHTEGGVHDLLQHGGRSHDLDGVNYSTGGTTTASASLIRSDDLTSGTRGATGVFALCEGVMTPEQAITFAGLILRAAAEARQDNNGGLVPSCDELRGLEPR